MIPSRFECPPFSVLQPQTGGSTGFVCWARGFMEMHSAPGQTALADTLQRYCSTDGTPALLLFPEEDTTNGRAGLLKFRWGPAQRSLREFL